MNGRTNSTDSRVNDVQIPLDAPTALVAIAGNAQVSLSWTDPRDKYATPEGEIAQDPQQLVSVWSYTKVVRKEGSEPVSPNDGITVIESAIRNQYESTEYVDKTVMNDVTYYYALFAYNEDGVYSELTVSDPVVPIMGYVLSELAEGTLIKINENGAPVEFYLAKHNYEEGLNGLGRDLFIRKDIPGIAEWSSDQSDLSNYPRSDISNMLNSTYKSRFSTTVQKLIGSTKYYWAQHKDSIIRQYSNSFILLSAKEYDLPIRSDDGYFQQNGYQQYGEPVPIASTLRVAGETQWTRNPVSGNVKQCIYCSTDGYIDSTYCDRSEGYRPAFTLPSSLFVNAELFLDESIYEETV